MVLVSQLAHIGNSEMENHLINSVNNDYNYE